MTNRSAPTNSRSSARTTRPSGQPGRSLDMVVRRPTARPVTSPTSAPAPPQTPRKSAPSTPQPPVTPKIAGPKQPVIDVRRSTATPAHTPVLRLRRPKQPAPTDPVTLATDRLARAAKHAAPVARKRRSWKSIVGSCLLVVLIGVVAYISYDTWSTNRSVKEDNAKTVQQAGAGESRLAAEGKDEAPASDASLANYKVAADRPRLLTINSLNITAKILPMDVNTDGSMQAPINIYDAGWYTGGAKPGEPGAAVIDAHASGPTKQGLFNSIDTMKLGDEVVVERGDGTSLRYKVTHKEEMALDAVDMAKVLRPYGQAKEGLNMITCSGNWTRDGKTFDHRYIVYTERVL